MNTADLIFREAAGREELLDLFRLRYETYRSSRLAGFVQENASGMDIDAHDAWARHFGVFQGTEAIGYIRVVQEEHGPYWQEVVSIAQQEGGQPAYSGEMPDVPFPLMGYWPDQEAIWKHYMLQHQAGQKMCEAGRLIVRHDARTPGLARLLIESSLAIYFLKEEYDHTMISCARQHSAMYYKYGFSVECSKVDSVINGVPAALLKSTPIEIPSTVNIRLLKMANIWSSINKIHFNHFLNLSKAPNSLVFPVIQQAA